MTAVKRSERAADEPRRPYGAIGLAVGVATGLADFAFMWWLDADMTIAGRDATFWIGGVFVATYGVLGLLVGRLAAARQRARADADTIARQMRALERAHAQVVQQEKLAALGRLAAGVAHEVRNPLGVIRASASMVRESFDADEDPYRACDFICEEIDRLNALIRGLLSFARPTEVAVEDVSPAKMIDVALQLAADELTRREVDVERRDDGVVGPVRADRDLLPQVLFGLLLNAAQAIDRRGRIVVSVADDGDAVSIDVADDGPGVDASVADQLFEPFVTTKASGTGLGLAMAERIVRAHGGSLAWLPDAGVGPGGRGARFRVVLHRGGPGRDSDRDASPTARGAGAR